MKWKLFFNQKYLQIRCLASFAHCHVQGAAAPWKGQAGMYQKHYRSTNQSLFIRLGICKLWSTDRTPEKMFFS